MEITFEAVIYSNRLVSQPKSLKARLTHWYHRQLYRGYMGEKVEQPNWVKITTQVGPLDSLLYYVSDEIARSKHRWKKDYYAVIEFDCDEGRDQIIVPLNGTCPYDADQQLQKWLRKICEIGHKM